MQCHLEPTTRRLPSLIRRFGRAMGIAVAEQGLGDIMTTKAELVSAIAEKAGLKRWSRDLTLVRMSSAISKSTIAETHDPIDDTV